MKSFIFNLGFKCKINKFRLPPCTFRSSSSSPGEGSLFHGCSFPCQSILLREAVGVLAFLFLAGLSVFFSFCPGAFFFFVVSPVCFFSSRQFLAFPITSCSFLFSFLVSQQHVPSFLFLSFPSPQANGAFL